jgi:bacteriocin leader peptide (microcyclamide/patellamide family)
MEKHNLMPHPAQPVNRVTTGQLPPELAELSEEALQQEDVLCAGASVLPAGQCSSGYCLCAYDGDDAE